MEELETTDLNKEAIDPEESRDTKEISEDGQSDDAQNEPEENSSAVDYKGRHGGATLTFPSPERKNQHYRA